MRLSLAALLVPLFLSVCEAQQKSSEELLEEFLPKEKVAELLGNSLPKVDRKQRLYSPNDASRAVAADAAALASVLVPEELYAIRYLSMANIPSEQRKLYAARVAFLVNSLSRKANMTIPARIGPDGIVIRVNLRDYGIDPAVWDRMGDVEPYFHEQVLASLLRVRTALKTTKVIKIWPGGYVPNGEYWPPGTQYYGEDEVALEQSKETVKSEKKLGFASWLDPKDSSFLLTTLQTRTPIVRADWFLANASLPPFYYDLLKIKTLDDVKELALFDERAKKVLEVRATVVSSGKKARKVGRNNRILFRFGTAYGAWWQTLDYLESVGEKNVINNFLTEKFDGGEIIFTLPNGLQGYFLIDGKNKRVDEVPIGIATDELAQDKRVRCGRSCIWCHTQGIQPFDSSFKLTVGQKDLVDLGLNDGDPKKSADLSRKIREVFEDPDFGLIVKTDNVRYANAIRAVTGTSAPSNAALFLQVYDRYAELELDAEDLVYESGVSDLDVQAAIKTKIDGSNSGVLLQRLLNLPIRRDHWEESHGEFMRRVTAWQAVRRATIKGK